MEAAARVPTCCRTLKHTLASICRNNKASFEYILQVVEDLRFFIVIMAIASYSQPAMRVTLLDVILNVKELH